MASNRTLEDVLQNAISSRDSFETHGEAATSQNIIRPSLEALGWNVLQLSEVVPEFTVPDGTKVDYCLRLNGTSHVLVEVKSAGTSLDKHEQQLVNYAFQEGAPIGVLTNGFEWRFFLPMASGKWQDRLFRTVVVAETPRAPATAIREVLARKALANGSALKAAQDDLDRLARERRLAAAVPAAWESLDIVKQLQDEIEAQTGDRPRKADLLKHLQEPVGGGASAPVSPRSAAAHKAWETRRASSSETSKDRTDAPARRDSVRQNANGSEVAMSTKAAATKLEAFWLDGQRYSVAKWKHMLIQVCDLLAVADPTKFDAFTGTFVSSRGKHYFSTKAADLINPGELTKRQLYVETSWRASETVRFTRKIITGVRGNDSGFQIEPQLL